jgi:hypothetical protein
MNIQGIGYMLQPVATLFADSLGNMALPIIIFIAIIFKVIKGFSNFSQSKPGTGQPKPRTDSLSPDTQIRDFLESLSGESKHEAQHEAQATMPPPVPQPVRRPEVRLTTKHTSYQISSVPRATAPAVPTVTMFETKPIIQPAVVPAMEVRTPVKVAVAVQRLPLRTSLIHKLAHRDSLREAILLREILGPPLALRRQMTRAFQE